MRYLAGGMSILAVAAALAVSGCGGGHGGSPATGGGGALTLAQRTAVMSAINEKYQTLPGQDLNADNQQLLDFVRTRPEFEASGLSQTGGVWARFTDGRLLVISNNRLPAAPPGKAPLHRGSRAPDLPAASSPIVLLVDTSSFAPDTVNAVAARMKTAGYHGRTGDATLDELRNVSSAAVFYMDCHSGDVMLRDGTTVFALETDSPIADMLDKTLADDLRSNAVGYMMAPGLFSVGGAKYQLTNTYFITAQFVRKYMSFDPNGVVCLNACNTDNAAAADLKQAFFDKGAGTYLGWTKDVDDKDAEESARYLFDRLLGETGTPSDYEAENPPQRPFDLAAIWQQMTTVSRRDGRSGTLTESKQAINLIEPPKGDDTARLTETAKTPSHTSLLAPTINYMEVAQGTDGGQQLHIAGLFGAKQGTVTLAGNPASIVSWSPSEVVIALPPAVGAAGEAGDVQVTIDRRKSNVVQLSEWALKFHCKDTITYSGTQQLDQNGSADTYSGTQTVDTDMVLYLRADIHTSRTAPGQNPPFTDGQNRSHATTLASALLPFRDARITQWSGSGTETIKHHFANMNGTSGDTTENQTVTGVQGATPLPLDGTDPRSWTHILLGTANPAAGAITLFFEFGIQNALSESIETTYSNGDKQTTTGVLPGLLSMVTPKNGTNAQITLRFDPVSGAISAGSGSGSDTVPNATISEQLSWSDATPVAGTAPDPNAARAARRRH